MMSKTGVAIIVASTVILQTVVTVAYLRSSKQFKEKYGI